MTTTESTETTLDLDQAIRDGMEEFTGEPNAVEVPEDDPITPSDPEPDSPPEDAATEPGEETEDPEARHAEDAAAETEHADADAETPAADKDEAKPKTEEKPFRFKSHEEAERGYRHIQSEKTRAERKARELEERLQAVERAEQAKTAQVKAEEEYVDFAATRRQKALDDIDALDEDDPDYRQKVSRVWAETDRDLHRFDWRKFDADGAEQPATDEAPPAAPDTDGQRKVVETMALDAGLDHEADLKMFRMVAGRTPEVDDAGRPMAFEEQVQWAISETKTLLDAQQARFVESQKKKAGEQNARTLAAESPMGRSGAAPRANSRPAAPVTLDDALQEAYEGRRL